MIEETIPAPIIVNIPYADFKSGVVQEELKRQVRTKAEHFSNLENATTWRLVEHLLLEYPIVYVVHAKDYNKYRKKTEYTVYVGETNNIGRRTLQHLGPGSQKREDWKDLAERLRRDSQSVWQYVIGDGHFNKSLTLDIENKLMHYLLGSEAVKTLNNRRANAQGDYYTQDEFDRLFSRIWRGLHRCDPDLFPSEEIIRNSALFKSSPFHRLSDEQIQAEESILTAVTSVIDGESTASDMPKLIFVQGAAGTGKTVLLSHLFYRMSTQLGIPGGFVEEEDIDDALEIQSQTPDTRQHRAYILVNHKQQVNVYNQIATKLGLQKRFGEIVLLPTQFINLFSECTKQGRGIPDKPRGRADIVLIDEAHLLLTQGSQGYSGKNMLCDVLRRAKIVIAVFDPNQVLQSSQQWNSNQLGTLFPNNELATYPKGDEAILEPFRQVSLDGQRFELSHIHLAQQFRIAADERTIKWVDDFAGGVGIDNIPMDVGEKDDKGNVIREPYEIKVFESPVELFKAIKEKASMKWAGADGHGLSRVVATYDWAYKDGKENSSSPDGLWNVEMHRVNGTWLVGLAENDRKGYDELTPDEDPDRFCHPWNYQIKATKQEKDLHDRGLAWAERPYTLNEVGSTFTIQGFDLNYVGVIIGPSVQYRNGEIVFSAENSKNDKATNKREGQIDYSKINLRNELNVLLKRGVHGLYLFAVDPSLQEALLQAQQNR